MMTNKCCVGSIQQRLHTQPSPI